MCIQSDVSVFQHAGKAVSQSCYLYTLNTHKNDLFSPYLRIKHSTLLNTYGDVATFHKATKTKSAIWSFGLILSNFVLANENFCHHFSGCSANGTTSD